MIEALTAQGYTKVRQLPDGRWIGLHQMLYTFGLFVDLGRTGYHVHYCYEIYADALEAVMGWDGVGDPPGPWIKVKSTSEDRVGPGAIGG